MPTFIPSPPPEWSQFSIGPLTLHAYALFIMAGIFFALWLTTKRWVERGGEAETVSEIAFWAVPFGIVGGRIYHVISSPAAYFGENGNPVDALKIWNGGLGIWGAIALGAVGAYIGARRQNVSFVTFLDSAAPAVLLAQAIGRLGNYFNQELFGGPTELPWGLEIDPQFRPVGYEQFATFHPTFLYEMLWNVAGAALIIWLDRKHDLRGGRVFWLYVMVYTSGRLWIETVRIDEAVLVGGLRINVWVSIVVLAASTLAFVWLGRRQAHASGPRVPRRHLATGQAPASDTTVAVPASSQAVDAGEHVGEGEDDSSPHVST
jgi:prolipoprotein diacylglyceryl transferase